jgi:two-component system chemotaxis response regulator CheB
MKAIKVLVVDDSPLVRKFIVKTLNEEEDMTVVDTAGDGLVALRKIKLLKPDVVTLDLNMPRMDGLAAIREMMRMVPVPVVVFSSANKASADIALKALTLGAVDFLPKPSNNTSAVIQKMKTDLKNKIRVASTVNMKAIKGSTQEYEMESMKSNNDDEDLSLPKKGWFGRGTHESRFFCIGCSTGGPQALEAIMKHIPSGFPGYIGIVQHMPEPFINVFAENLNRGCNIEVKIAENGDIFEPGRALLSPGNAHMVGVKSGSQLVAHVQPFKDGSNQNYPSVDKFFYSIAKNFRKLAVGILLTGMGKDGALGMKAIKTVGGSTIAQDASTSIVYGMPKAALELKAVDKIVALPHIHAIMKRMI